MTAKLEPWWIPQDREALEQMRNAIAGKADTDRVWYIGDQRGAELVSEVRAKIKALEARIPQDIARFQAVNGDYEAM